MNDSRISMEAINKCTMSFRPTSLRPSLFVLRHFVHVFSSNVTSSTSFRPTSLRPSLFVQRHFVQVFSSNVTSSTSFRPMISKNIRNYCNNIYNYRNCITSFLYTILVCRIQCRINTEVLVIIYL